MSQPNVEAAIAYALHRLQAEIPAQRTYHSAAHTRDDVLPAVARLARLSGVDEIQTDLLRVAAAFHDLGYAERPDDHEVCSVRIAAQSLPRFGFDSPQVEDVMSLILVTRLPQRPRNLLEAIMADADLDSLGRDDFMQRNLELLQELRTYGADIEWGEWLQEQVTFMRSHSYFTPAARQLRDESKARNLALIEELLAAE